jgi:hypothetical protein
VAPELLWMWSQTENLSSRAGSGRPIRSLVAASTEEQHTWL